MKKIPNKRFLYPVGTRLWNLYKSYGNVREPQPFQTFNVNAKIVSGWKRCEFIESEGRGYCPRRGKTPHCPSGGMKAILSNGQQCVCDNGVYDKWVDENGLRDLAEENNLRNRRIDKASSSAWHSRASQWRGHRRNSHVRLPKVWKDIKDKLVY